MAKYFKNSFGVNGDLEDIPDDMQTDGSISYSDGYSSFYQLDPATDATAKRIERTKMNKLFYVIASNIKQWQEQNFPDWVSDAGNGTPYAYDKGVIVTYTDGKQYVSKIGSNTSEPTTDTNWKLIDFSEQNGVPSGAIFAFPSLSIPSGYLACNGSAISRVTYLKLFSIISTTYGAGNGSTTFNLSDLRGEFIRGFDNGRGVDSGRTIGSWQEDDFKSHTHPLSATVAQYGGVGSGTGNWVTSGSSPLSIKATGGDETRPRNIAMVYCIKC